MTATMLIWVWVTAVSFLTDYKVLILKTTSKCSTSGGFMSSVSNFMSCTKCDVWRTQINLSVLSHCSKNTQAHAFPFEFLTSHKWRVDVGCCHTPLDGCCRVQWEGLFAAVASHNVVWGAGASNMKTSEQTDLSHRVVQVQVSDQWTEKRSHHHFIV